MPRIPPSEHSLNGVARLFAHQLALGEGHAVATALAGAMIVPVTIHLARRICANAIVVFGRKILGAPYSS